MNRTKLGMDTPNDEEIQTYTNEVDPPPSWGRVSKSPKREGIK